MHLALERVLVQQLAARYLVELSSRLGKLILVRRLDFRLSRQDRTHKVVVGGEIDRRGGAPGERQRRERYERPQRRRPQHEGSDRIAARE